MGYNHFRLARRVDADTLGLYKQDLTKLLSIDDATAGVITIAPTGVSGIDTVYKANDTDTYPFIKAYGNSGFDLELPASAGSFSLLRGGVEVLQFGEDVGNTNSYLKSTRTNYDLSLEANGTGVVMFGTHTGTGDVVSNGHITIKDEAGNSRKLMTTA